MVADVGPAPRRRQDRGRGLALHVGVLGAHHAGSGDGGWLAGAMAATFALYLPLVLLVHAGTARLESLGDPLAVGVLWVVFMAFMAIRWGFLRHRVRGDAWLVTGAGR